MGKVMIQLCFPSGHPSVAEAAQSLGLAPEDLDPEFGVIATDPVRNLYAIRVPEEAAARAAGKLGERSGGAEGIFSDPKIAPFGPPED